MVAYQVNGQCINNIFLALHRCWKTGTDLKFYCYDDEYDRYDWSKEPESSLDQLMAAHARNLRDRYQRLILLWSGGTDSHTIYNIFRTNRIRIDEIIIKAGAKSLAFPEANVDWIRQNHWDPSTIITRYDDHDTNLRLLDLPNEDWVWRDKGDLLKYGMTSSGDGVKFLCEKNHSGHSWRAIAGYEKPRLVYRQGRWYHRQLAMVLQPTMGHDYIEHFFLQPLIAIKQSHLVKRSVKRLLEHSQQPLYDGDWAEAKWPNTAQDYRAWARACGRHDEVNLGVSHMQKYVNNNLDQTEINLSGNWKELRYTFDRKLQHDLSTNNQAAINYVRGLHNLTAESGFTEYLTNKGYFKRNASCFTSLSFTWSKEYDLGT